MKAAIWAVSVVLICVPQLVGCGSEENVSSERFPDGSGAGSSAGGSGGHAGWAQVDSSAAGSSGSTGDDAGSDADNDAGDADSGAGGCVSATTQALSLATGWGDYNTATYLRGGYYLDANGDVHLEGLITKLDGVPAQYDVIGTLPVSLRPAKRHVFTGYSKGYGRVDVNADGDVIWVSGATTEKDYIALGEVSFRPGAAASDGWMQPPLGTWLDYGGSYELAGYRKDGENAVHLRGLVKKAGAMSGETVFTLPEQFRPEHRLLFLVASGGSTAGRIDVLPDGRVIWYPGNPGYASLSGLSFHVPPVAFEPAVMEGAWTAYSTAHAPAGYYKDCSGRVHLRGLVTEGAAAPAQGVIFTLPAGYRPAGRSIFPVATRLGSGAEPTTGRVDVHADGRVMWMSGGTFEKDWTSLSGISFVAAN